MHRGEVDIHGVYIRELRSSLQGELLSSEQLVRLSQTYSKGRMADLLIADIRSDNYIGARSLLVKKDNEELPTAPLSMGLARMMLGEHGLGGMIEVLPVEDEKNKKKYELTGEKAAALLYTWRISGSGLKDKGEIVRSLGDISSEAVRAREKIISSNLRLVVSIAKKYRQKTVQNFGDYVQEGNLGLIHAVDKYDWRTGNKFSTYATRWIKQSIGRAIIDKEAAAPVPQTILQVKSKVEKAKKELEDAGLGQNADAIREKINKGLDKKRVVSREVVVYFLERHHAQKRILSLEEPLGDENSDAELLDILPDPQAVDPEEEVVAGLSLQEQIHVVLDKLDMLTKREREVLMLRYLNGGKSKKTQAEVALALGIGDKSVYLYEKNAISKIKLALGIAPEVKKEVTNVKLTTEEVYHLMPFADLSSIDLELVDLLYDCGFSTKEAAAKIGISHDLMRIRKRRFLKKLISVKEQLAA